MTQPEGFIEKDKKDLVCWLNKSLYGLKQASRCWYKRFNFFIVSLGFKRCKADYCAYIYRYKNSDFIILLLYVDDMLVSGTSKNIIAELKAYLIREFEMKDLGFVNQILGMNILRDRKNRKLWITQKGYVEKVLRYFNIQNSKPVSTPFPMNFKLSSE